MTLNPTAMHSLFASSTSNTPGIAEQSATCRRSVEQPALTRKDQRLTAESFEALARDPSELEDRRLEEPGAASSSSAAQPATQQADVKAPPLQLAVRATAALPSSIWGDPRAKQPAALPTSPYRWAEPPWDPTPPAPPPVHAAASGSQEVSPSVESPSDAEWLDPHASGAAHGRL